MTPLDELGGYVSRGEPVPFPWVVEHCPDGTLHEVWTSGARHVDNVTRLDLLQNLGASRAGRARLKRAVLAVVAADGATVESRWGDETTGERFSTHYVATVTQTIPKLAKELSRRRVSSARLVDLYSTLRRATVNDACAERGAYNAWYQQTHAMSGRCYHGDCTKHVAHEDVASCAARLLAGYTTATPFLDEVHKTLSCVVIRRAILAAVPALQLDEAFATRTP